MECRGGILEDNLRSMHNGKVRVQKGTQHLSLSPVANDRCFSQRIAQWGFERSGKIVEGWVYIRVGCKHNLTQSHIKRYRICLRVHLGLQDPEQTIENTVLADIVDGIAIDVMKKSRRELVFERIPLVAAVL